MTWAGSYRATPAVQDFASATTYAVNKATGTVAGDLILLWCANNGSTFTCTGFVAHPGTYDYEGTLFVRTANGTEGSTFTVTQSGSASPAEIIQATIAGPCSIDVVGASGDGAPSANPTATGLTVAGQSELLLWFGSSTDASSVGTLVATSIPSGFTSRVTGTPGTTGRPDTLLCDNTAVAAGATGAVAATQATSQYWVAMMAAIKPPSLTPATVTGVTATVTISAPAGSVSATSTATIAGVAGTFAIAAPAGTVKTAIAVAGVAGTVALAAPAGIVKTSIVLSGVAGTSTIAAP